MSVTQAITERPVGTKPEEIGPWINRELIPLLKQLRAEVNGLTSLPPSGAAGGQLGGTYPNPDVRGVRETSGPTELTMGAVADGEFLKRSGSSVIGAAGAVGSSEGSIFSMVGPAGASAPVVAYDFTNYDSGLSIAQNLAAANLSGDSSLDLSAQGSARMNWLCSTSGGFTFSVPYAWTPFGAGDGALFTGAQTHYVITTGAPAALRIAGALTVEWLGYMATLPGVNEDNYIFDCSAAGETEAANVLYMLQYRGSAAAAAAWYYIHETGAGTDQEKGFFATGNAASALFEIFQYAPVMLTLTRDSSGVVNLYVNGRKSEDEGAAPVALPTGGTTSNLSIGFGSASNRFAILGTRVFNVELTAAQVRASYHRTFFGVSA